MLQGLLKMLEVKRLVFLLFLAVPLTLLGQNASNWINFSQTYYKIPVAKDGIYRLTYNDLDNVDFPVNSVDPRLIQIYHRGVQQAIFFKHNQTPADAKFDSGEYLEFYGQRNDGTLDSKLYQPNSDQPHAYYNLYSDTSAYFLTWSLSPVQGKRMSSFSEVNVTNIPKETSHIDQKLSLFTSDYSGGDTFQDLIEYSHFNKGEGWTGSVICSVSSGCTGQQDFVLENITNSITSAANPQLELQMVGRDDLAHGAEVYVGSGSGSLRLISTTSFVNFETATITLPINWSDIGVDGKMVVRVKAIGSGGNRDRISVSYIKLNFAQGFDLTGQTSKKLNLLAGTGKSYIEMTNAPGNARVWDITDVNNIVIIGTGLTGSTLSAVIPNTTTARRMLVTNQVATPSIEQVSFRNINPASHNYLIVSHPSLMRPALGYGDAVKAFASYRASAEGGAYDTLTISIDQLYNQYNYGETSSLAIYEFLKFMYAGGHPKYLFLIGKGREVYDGMYRRALAAGESRDLVPTGGYPASDMVFSAGLGGLDHVPAIATGRIPATTPAQVAAYLNKVKESEASPYSEVWHKEVLHLSGGIQPFELTLFKQYMDGFAYVAEDEFYGGNVKTLGKHEASPIELINISKEINEGVNLVTFFGHSAPNATDIDIGYASEPTLGYNNPGKYPVFLVNGCSAGAFFSNGANFGEDWILSANKGARGFMANSSYGFSNDLRLYTELFYQLAFADSAGIRSGVGDVQMAVAKKYFSFYSTPNINAVALSHQMVLLGDPAVKLFGAGKPDLSITNGSVSAIDFESKPVTALTDSFALKLIVKNFGVSTKVPMKIKVERKFTDNSTAVYYSSYKQPLREDTLTFVIHQERGRGFGNNIFTVTLDSENAIEEITKENNIASLSLFIPLSGTKNLFPFDFSIVNKSEVNLVFQNTNLLSDERQYDVEVDTINSFNSSVIQKFTITGKSLLAKKIQILSSDSTVYYWRTRLAQPTSDENKEWQTNSFIYVLNGKEGWAQARPPQFADDVTSGLVREPSTGKLDFVTTSTELFIKTFGKDNPSPPANAALNINGADYWHSIQGFDCRDNTINLIAFNKNTVVPYQGIAFTYLNAGRRACGREPQLINSFLASETDTGNGDDIVQYVDNIKASDSVVLFTLGDAGLNLWSSTVKNKLGEFGISVAQIDAILPGEPVIIFGRKGAPAGTAKIIRSTLTPEPEQELVLNKTLTGKLSSGSLQSTRIGPAQSWKQFASKVKSKTASDEIRFDLYGIQSNGTEELIQSDIGQSYDLSSISASQYPNLKLLYFTKDDTELTTAQLKNWFVLFEPVAEGILVYKGSKEQQTLQEGEVWTGNYSFVNISEKTFKDSLSVEVGFLNKQTLTEELNSFKIKPPLPGDSSNFRITKKPKAGVSNVDVFVNHYLQPELYYENNTLELIDYINVLRDRIPPVLDVSIDGRYVINGDFVSANPTMVVLLKDENSLIYKTDTLGVGLFLKYPCATETCSFTRIKLSGSNVKWSPASTNEDFKIVFTPTDLPEGEYTLRVQAQDATGNTAGSDPYEVTFVVQKETSVRFTPAYPNPSTSDFYFTFQLAGQEELEKFSLQFWTPDGKAIASYTEDDLSSSYIGIHELKWSAKDQEGNLLMPGVYIYKIEVTAGGKTESTFGKIVIVR